MILILQIAAGIILGYTILFLLKRFTTNRGLYNISSAIVWVIETIIIFRVFIIGFLILIMLAAGITIFTER